MGVKNVLKDLVRFFYLSWQRRRFAHFGEDSYISPFGMYGNPRGIPVGDHVYVGPRAILSAS